MTRTRLLVDGDVFHLPGGHNQKSHGNRAGKKDNTPGKTSRHAPIIEKLTRDNEKAPVAQPVTPARERLFEEKIDSARKGDAAFGALSHSDRGALLTEYETKRGDTDPDVDEMSRMIGAYQGPAFTFINSGLRNPDTRESTLTNDDMGPVINGLDTAMDMSTTTDDIVVYRGIRRPSMMFAGSWNEEGDNSGLEWVDEGYTSTTTDRGVTDKFIGFAGPDSIIMRMLIPRGTRALAPDTDPRNSDEKEIVINRGQRARTVRDYRDPTTGQRILDVEVIK